MHLRSASPRQPAIPAVGFLNSAPARANVLNLADFRHRSGKTPVVEARDPRIKYLRTEDQKHDPPPKLFDYFAAVFVVMSAAFGPAVMWLLVK
jgi:hypothetical protein